jgi:hypothetical protein
MALWALILFSGLQSLFGVRSGLPNLVLFASALGLVSAAYYGSAFYAALSILGLITGILINDRFHR